MRLWYELMCVVSILGIVAGAYDSSINTVVGYSLALVAYSRLSNT